MALEGCIWDLGRLLQQGELEIQAAAVCYIRIESCVNRIMVRCSSFCDLTPRALGFVISSCLDLLIGSPQAAFAQSFCH